MDALPGGPHSVARKHIVDILGQLTYIHRTIDLNFSKSPSMFDLFLSLPLDDLTLSNRIVMAPMTRNRASAQGVPSVSMATYYGQRASAGLVVSESAPISPQAIGYPHTPGLFNAAQVAGWH